MADDPNPITNPNDYDTIEVAGVESPGVVTLSGHDREIDWDVKIGAGTTGGTTTLKAAKLIEFSASIYMADVDDFNDWPAFQEVLESSVKGKGKGLEIFHPDLARNGIKSVVLRSLGGTIHDKKGGQTRVVKLLEYRPPAPAKVTPIGSKTSTTTDPNAAANAELAKLTAQYKATPWG